MFTDFRDAAAPAGDDWTIPQNWAHYTAEDHRVWDLLFARQQARLAGRAVRAFEEGLDVLRLSHPGIPDFDELNARLFAQTGWTVVAVPGLVPDDVFFRHLSRRQFPAGNFIRSAKQLDYLEEPDIFHDVFGHVPLLANPVYADFMQAYGKGGQRAISLGRLQNLARLYWYTVEFGLIRTAAGLRIFGAGIMSSTTESVFALESSSPHRIGFDLERVMRTKYLIDDFQQTYFVIESFEKLLDDCYQDFGPIYQGIGPATDIEADEILDGDEVVTRGTLAYFKRKHA